MATITKSYANALAHTAITHPDTVKGSTLDVSTKLACMIVLYHALVEAAANTNPGFFSVQGSVAASGDNDWVELCRYYTAALTAGTEELSEAAGEPAGETVLAVASTTGLTTPGQVIYIQDDDTLAQSEWRYLQEYANNASVTILDGLEFDKVQNDTIWDSAEIFRVALDLTALGRLRVVFCHEGAAGANCHVKAEIIYGDSIG